jgi:hypothetical protein
MHQLMVEFGVAMLAPVITACDETLVIISIESIFLDC